MGRQPPWERSADAEPGSFGTWLRRQRELREISLRDVAERTKISLRYLEAMEDDRFDLLPAPVFAKGFLREYARYIGLSPDEVVNHYLSVHGLDGSETAGDDAPDEGAADRPRRRVLVAVALALLAALAVAGYLYYERIAKPRRQAAPVASEPEAAPAGAPAPLLPTASEPMPSEAVSTEPEAPRSPIEVTLDFTRDCWVEATVDGKAAIAEQRVAGESLPIYAQKEVILKLGNASGVEAQVNGYPFPLPPGQGQVVRDLKIDLETVRALREKKAAG